jgi:ComF family protein
LSNGPERAFDSGAPDARSGGMRARWRRIAGRAAQAARASLPQACALCVAPAGDALICTACAAALPRLPPACPVCALPCAGACPCGRCLKHPPPYAATVAAFVYAFPVDRLLQQLKYGGRLAFAEWAAAQLATAAAAALRGRDEPARPDRIVAMPLAAARQRERGFNQAQEIAARVAAALGIRVAHPLLRVAAGAPQAALPWAARARNVRGAFACRTRQDGARIAIVDDVMTTGATLAEAGATLRGAGAARVECWVVARTLPPAAA